MDWIAEYCREIETYLCRKNDGHLIRVVGPSFELVSRWAERGIPLKVACAGIGRYFDRYYRGGPRHRPVKIDFCEADVLDAFDEWRRAVGLPASPDATEPGASQALAPERRGPSLPAHLERAVQRLTASRASGALGPSFDRVIDRVARELDAARATASGIRGAARQALVGRLDALDAELLQLAHAALDEPTRAALVREADDALAAYRSRMAPEGFARARDAATARLVRERLGLPTIAFTQG